MSQLLPEEAEKQTQSGSYLVSRENKEPSADPDAGVSLETEGATWSPSSDRLQKVSPLISSFCFLEPQAWHLIDLPLV